MNPIFSSGRLPLYVVAWLPVGILLTLLAAMATERSWLEAASLCLPLAYVCAFLGLGSWSLCRAMPLEETAFMRLAVAHAGAAAISSGVWLLIGAGWSIALGVLLGDPGIPGRYVEDLPLFFVVGVLLFILSSAIHYVLIAFEASREAERRALELKVLARDAQVKTLTAQINPHFLFNSLNAISALTSSDPGAARRMCLLLAEFLRATLRLGPRERITLSEELALVQSYLAVEQVRFADRLRVDTNLDPDAAECLLPPLLLQPLAENAVVHGVAHLVDGGTVLIRAHRAGDEIEISVENPVDPERPPSRGHGVGLSNVRARVATLFGPAGRVEASDGAERYRVVLTIPAEAPAPGATA